MNRYPTTLSAKPDDLKATLDWIQRERLRDIDDRNNFPNLFVGGRKVAKVPTSSTDITGSAVGDFNVTGTFAYFCVNIAGTVTWVRIAVGTW